MVEVRGVEPLTFALRTRRSAKLSYTPSTINALNSITIALAVQAKIK